MWEITSTWRGSDRCTHITIDTPAGEVELYRTEDSRDAALFKAQLLLWQGIRLTPTPEAQKVQDEPDVGVGARIRSALERNHQKVAAQIDHEVLTAPEAAATRTQAIKDVAKYIKSNPPAWPTPAYVIYPSEMVHLENGKIPE